MASTSYEIHAEENHSWRIFAVLDNMELALIEARRLHSSARYDRIRVVREEVEGNPYLARVEANLFVVELLGTEKQEKSRKREEKVKVKAPRIGAPIAGPTQPKDDSEPVQNRASARQNRASARQNRASARQNRASARQDRALAREKSEMLGNSGGSANINPNTVIVLMFSAVVIMAVALIFVLLFK